MLELWHQLKGEKPRTVSQFVEEIALWLNEGIVDADVWKSLEPIVQPEVLLAAQRLTDVRSKLSDSDEGLFQIFLTNKSDFFKIILGQVSFSVPLSG